jgi:predicted RNA-binding Zn ribbon-like protein
LALSHDTTCALRTAVALVNSSDSTSDSTAGEDRLDDPPALRRFLEQHDFSAIGRLAAADVTAVQALRHRVRSVFSTRDVREAVKLVNALVAKASALPQLVDHDGEPWHLHYTPPGAALVDRLAAESGMALAIVIRDEGLERLRICEAPGCANALVDLSRNRSRRYCDTQGCGNRVHVAAYRARRRAGQSPNRPAREEVRP